jgi:hypothetical protein
MERTLNTHIVRTEREESWSYWTLKTVGLLILTVPLLTLNGFLSHVVTFRASLAPYQTLEIYWDEVPGVLLESGRLNLIGFPIAFYVGAVITFVVARVLGGKGSFWFHSFEIAVAYSKVVGLAFGFLALTYALPVAGFLGIFVLAALLKWMVEAIAEVHAISTRRGCVAMLFLVAIPVFLVALLALLGPVVGDGVSGLIIGLL